MLDKPLRIYLYIMLCVAAVSGILLLLYIFFPSVLFGRVIFIASYPEAVIPVLSVAAIIHVATKSITKWHLMLPIFIIVAYTAGFVWFYVILFRDLGVMSLNEMNPIDIIEFFPQSTNTATLILYGIIILVSGYSLLNDRRKQYDGQIS